MSVWKYFKDWFYRLKSVGEQIRSSSESPMFYIRSVTIKGNRLFTTCFLKSKLNFSPTQMYSFDDIYNKIWFSEKGDDIASLYMNKGYLFFDVELIPKEIDSQTLDITLKVTEGDIYKIGDVTVTGLFCQDLGERILFKRGERFSRLKVKQTYENLLSIEAKPIKITPKANKNTRVVDVDIQVG
ncbi:MAG: hypothetical protein NZM38_07570 [Cytophagales bacterium]|nr:hypothetical protein [Cytophagales bacterium]MDW8384616.1 POTRA domain-containing protein [Flammeovirgaceae bacterium]